MQVHPMYSRHLSIDTTTSVTHEWLHNMCVFFFLQVVNGQRFTLLDLTAQTFFRKQTNGYCQPAANGIAIITGHPLEFVLRHSLRAGIPFPLPVPSYSTLVVCP